MANTGERDKGYRYCHFPVSDACIDAPYNFLNQYSVHRLLIHHWVLSNDFLNVDGVRNLLHNSCHNLLHYLWERKNFSPIQTFI